MAVEKFIRGKHDDGKHDGLYANRKRLLNALEEAGFGEQIMVSQMVYRQRDTMPPDLVTPHVDFLRFWGLLPEVEMQPGVEYPLTDKEK